MKPAIVVVAYDRIDTLERLLGSIGNAYYEECDITLIISIDYSSANEQILQIAESFEWENGEKRIVNHSSNLGLRNHILECGDYSQEYGSIIILEDDLVVSPDFYNYAKKAQEFYEEDKRIAGVALYSHEWNGYVRKKFTPIQKEGDVFFGQFSVTWGQCWSDSQWREFKAWYNGHPDLPFQTNMPENICKWSEKSWGKYFVYYILETNKYYVMPYVALSTCFSEAGVHIKNVTLDNQVCLRYGKRQYSFAKFEDGMHYDIFFENQDVIQFLKKYTDGNTNICISLYGNKQVDEQYDYVLTLKRSKGILIKSFGLQMRPIELNVFFEVTGEEIFLYRCKEKKRAYDLKRNRNFNALNYEAEGMPWQDALKYGMLRAVRGVRMVIENVLK